MPQNKFCRQQLIEFKQIVSLDDQRWVNIVEIQTNERMQWQKDREYGRRNYSELGVQRYQRTFGDAMHARDFSRQQQEAMIASGELNKMTSLGMPKSRRSA